MGWLETRTGGVELEESPSETARFGHRVERLTVGAAWSESFTRDQLVEAVTALLAGSSAHTVILRYPAEISFLIRGLEVGSRRVYPAGSLLYWDRATAESAVVSAVAELQAPIEEDVASSILAVIADSFSGYVNHYDANPFLPATAVSAGYVEWAGSTLRDPDGRVFVVRDGTAIAGVATVATERSADGSVLWNILLAGMATAAQGKGLYLTLVRGVLGAAAAQGVDRVLISTQSHNIPVQRAWAKLGFSPVAAIDTVHLVRG